MRCSYLEGGLDTARIIIRSICPISESDIKKILNQITAGAKDKMQINGFMVQK